MSPGSGFISPDGDQGSSNLVILEYRALNWLGEIFSLDRREGDTGGVLQALNILGVSVRVLEPTEEIVILIGGEVVLRLVPVCRGPGGVMRGPGHVLQQGLLAREGL